MTAQPEALRLADALEISSNHGIRREAANELRRLYAENFALPAGQCMNVVGDESGTPICAKAAQLQAARERDNVSFKQLLAQRDALLEALKTVEWHGGGSCWVVDADKIAAAIKASEEGK